LGWMKMISKTPVPKIVGNEITDLGDWLAQAKYAAWLFDHPNPDVFHDTIEFAARVRHRKFFIDLGKCLSGEINPELWDKRDLAIAEIVLSNPRIRAKDAVRELEKRGHRGMSEENFRNWKSKLLRAKRERDARLDSRTRKKI
jgi:hypothetical protein